MTNTDANKPRRHCPFRGRKRADSGSLMVAQRAMMGWNSVHFGSKVVVGHGPFPHLGAGGWGNIHEIRRSQPRRQVAVLNISG